MHGWKDYNESSQKKCGSIFSENLDNICQGHLRLQQENSMSDHGQSAKSKSDMVQWVQINNKWK